MFVRKFGVFMVRHSSVQLATLLGLLSICTQASCTDDLESGATNSAQISDDGDAIETGDEPETVDLGELEPENGDAFAPAHDDGEDHELHDAATGTDEQLESGESTQRARPSCRSADLQFTRWPLNGINGKHWMINNYLDLDASSNRLDYMGNVNGLARTYEGHRGIDVDISSFREMDSGSAGVYAAAPGVVESVVDSNFDRNTSCTGSWNVVKVRAANGYAVFYGHIKKGSALVSVGTNVVAGTKLGIAGSSGCSTQPHLHFEVQDCSNTAVETMNLAMWNSPPVYDPPSNVMDVMLKKGSFSTANEIKDPAVNPSLYKPGDVLGIGLSASIRGGDAVQLALIDPHGGSTQWSWTVPGVARYGHWYPSWTQTLGSVPGIWSLQVKINGSLKSTTSIPVSNVAAGWGEVARHGVANANYQDVFNDISAAGYRPVWVDGFDANGSTYFNAIFRPAGNVPWVARHGLTGSQYQSEFNTWIGAGYRVLQVDSYLSGGSVRYAVIFTKEAGPSQVAYHGVTEVTHQSNFNTYVAQGYRLVNASVVSIGGTRYVTALYDKAAVGGWVAKHAIPVSSYQNEFNAQTNAGRTLKYLNGYVHNGVAYYSAVWDSVGLSSWVARHEMTSSSYQSEFNTWTGSGFETRFVTGYDNGGARYGALWQK
jgi:murein DD-endopeptidase MepM/ murein hydrolase activator NlpD